MSSKICTCDMPIQLPNKNQKLVFDGISVALFDETLQKWCDICEGKFLVKCNNAINCLVENNDAKRKPIVTNVHINGELHHTVYSDTECVDGLIVGVHHRIKRFRHLDTQCIDEGSICKQQYSHAEDNRAIIASFRFDPYRNCADVNWFDCISRGGKRTVSFNVRSI